MSKLDVILGGLYDHKIDNLPVIAKQQIKDLMLELIDDFDSSLALWCEINKHSLIPRNITNKKYLELRKKVSEL